jgi:SNF2 family DNA or RNA helicase
MTQLLEELFDFQRADVEFLGDKTSCLIANEMGTGKTFEAGARDWYIRKVHGDGNTLVVAPTTVLPAWEDFFAEHTDLKTVRIDPKNREASWKEYTEGDAHVFLVHWEALRLMPYLNSIHWLHVIVDECHRMKNRKAQQTQALKEVKNVSFRTALSGTPVVNAPHEFWSVLNWLYPKQYGSYWKFFNSYTSYEIQYPQGFRKVNGPKNVDQLQSGMKDFYVRRLKKDVLKDLPDKYYTSINVDLTPPQRKAYKMMKSDMIAWIGQHEEAALIAPVVIAQLTRLQQFAVAYASFDSEGKLHLDEPSSKLDALMQILEDNPDEQIVVFSRFKSFVHLAMKRFEKHDISYVELTGDIPQADRGGAVQRFQDGLARVFIGTIAAGGVGITLTAASTVVFVDRDWSPALNSQAEDRLHRIGQKNAVQVVDIMARGTIDLGRHQMLELKWDWIRQLLGDD